MLGSKLLARESGQCFFTAQTVVLQTSAPVHHACKFNETAGAALACPPAREKRRLSHLPHQKGKPLDTTTLLRTAAVVRHWRHVRDRVDPDAQGAQCAHRGLTARTWALDLDIQILDALILSCTTCYFGSDLGCERRRLARALEALSTAGSPGQCTALAVGDRDDRVIERRVNVCNAIGDVLANLLANALRSRVIGCFCHLDLLSMLSADHFLPVAADLRGPLRVRAFVRVR